MTLTLEMTALVASCVSVIIGLLAIGLSVSFFVMSSNRAKEAREASKDISSSVERLEKLFDKLYSGTFSLVQDTVTDMRKHMWADDQERAREVEEEAEK